VGAAGGGAEPNIAVAPDGTLYVSSPLSVWRSGDHGKSWTKTASRGLEGGGDGDIAVGPGGTLYWLGLGGGSLTGDLMGAAPPVRIPFQLSRDGGESWSKAVDLSNGTGSDREWIDATPDGKLYATWRGGDANGNFLEFRASLDGGSTWQRKAKVGPDGDEGPVAHDPVSGRLYIADVDQADPADPTVASPNVFVYTSTDQGAAWTSHKVTQLPRSSPVEPNGYASDFPVVAVDGNGTAYLAYSGPVPGLPGVTPPEEASLYGIYLTVSRDQGEHWSAPRLLSDPSKDARFPWIAAGAPGRVAAVWYENVHGVPGEELPDQWNVRLWESVTADHAQPASVTVTLTSTPNHLGSLCTAGTGCAAADRSLLDFFELAIAPSGQPVVAFGSSTAGTGVGVAAQGTDVYFGTVDGTSLL
jgi:hypothetical protein